MIAEVYPILKLPRKCSYFDYDIPPDLKLAPGDLVRVPFKGRESLGVVRGLKNSSEAKRLMAVNSLAKPAYLSSKDLLRYEHIASYIVQSVSSLISTVLPTTFFDGPAPLVHATGSSHIGTLDIPVLERCLGEITLNRSVVISGDKDIGFALAHVLRRKRSGQMLVLLPRERDAELLARYVKLGESTSLLHGKTTPKDRSRIVEAWRTGKLETLIGTRNTSLLPTKSLTTVLVLESGNEEYVNERRNPRFDAREAAKLLAKDHEAHLVFFDSVPRLEELVTSPLITTTARPDDSVVINLGSSDELTNEALLSDSVIFGVENALQSHKKVLLFLNRKGVAKRLQCGKCGHVPLCGTCGHVPMVRHDDLVCANCQTEMWIPAQCPSCGKPKLALRGIGGTKMAATLQKLFPTATIGRLEKGNVENPKADIVVATEYFFSSYLEPFTAKRFGLVVDLAADISLHASDFRGVEETARKLHRLVNFAERQGAQVLVQTWLPEIVRPMLDLPTFVAAELKTRQQYNLPPYAARFVLHDAQFEELPIELKDCALERNDTIELTLTAAPLPSHGEDERGGHITQNELLKRLPDTIKIQYEGPYDESPSHESSP